ncbi:protein hypothetical protein [Limosa lapponica baueri]|uniref:AATF leucine zipper-containing domain-containing protein n=1 Tax=Limosa lapponica baueri TaxID=1758121 RepID=A0A2I0TGX1_LIMLA|nr:protein hypothetical protein [Limosa lapponica baueri]
MDEHRSRRACCKALEALLKVLVELQDELLYQYPGTRHLVDGKQSKAESDEEIPSSSDEEQVDKAQEKRKSLPKRKLKMEDYPEFIAKRYADFRTYRNNVLQKWHEKTKLASGKMGKGFGAFERSILTQIDHIMMDKERLLRRTQTKRSVYTVLGKQEQESHPAPESLPENSKSKWCYAAAGGGGSLKEEEKLLVSRPGKMQCKMYAGLEATLS